MIKNLRISKKTCKICGKREKTHGGLRDGQPQWGALEASAKPLRHSDRGELLTSCVMFVREGRLDPRAWVPPIPHHFFAPMPSRPMEDCVTVYPIGGRWRRLQNHCDILTEGSC